MPCSLTFVARSRQATMKESAGAMAMAAMRWYGIKATADDIDPIARGLRRWNIGLRSRKVIPKVVHPLAMLSVYVYGVAYLDDYRGWWKGY
jgi:hypothetical protein